MSDFNGNYLKRLRIAKKMSQTELAKILGISNRAVSKWETELSSPSSKNIFRLANIFSVSVDSFFEREDGTQSLAFSVKPKYMQSMVELYKIGRGPSSSHTIGPEKASLLFKQKNPDADSFVAVLYGSLAKTGKGHGTDAVIKKTFAPKSCTIEFNLSDEILPHPNTMKLFAYTNGKITDSARVFSVGGGSIVFEGEHEKEQTSSLYSQNSFKEIADYCKHNEIRLWQYALEAEGSALKEHIAEVWKTMKNSIRRGLNDEGELPGGLGVMKKAKVLYSSQHIDESAETRENRLVCAYAFAVSEQNASGETIATAPTCGSAGVLPAVLYYEQQKHGFTDEKIHNALISAGVVGNLIKTNASISGAECGCQAEIGTACAMAAAALAELFELDIDKIEYAAEIAIEHHLGLTCDPICGLVQIPCIERNAVAAMRAINALSLSSLLYSTRKISLDKVIETMHKTGLDMHRSYKETSEAGLAKLDIR